ncbi:MAG TPA: hypothetical protein VKR61_13765 [Bryobacteraceae bacterium]|nr:hypothetical protein [Bryobacteraceae bacterium]
MRILFDGALLVLGAAALMWIMRRTGKTRRPDHLDGYAIVERGRSRVYPYPYVYVNADGSARELHPDERDYLETPFQPGDGGRPYVKGNYSQKNGWGEVAGFLKRSHLPKEIVIQAAPAENPIQPLTRSDQIQFLRDKGLLVTENPDGTFTVRKP